MYKTKVDFVIPAGCVVYKAPNKSEYYTEHGEVTISFDKDTTASLRFDLEEALKLGVIEEV